MSTPTQRLNDRWRSGQMVGEKAPQMHVYVQKGFFKRGYRRFKFLDGNTEDFGQIAKNKHNRKPWQAWWRHRGDWIEVPNVGEVTFEEQLDQDGIAAPESCTIHVENIFYKEVAGTVGMYHAIKRGYFAPFYGLVAAGRTRNANAQSNEWLNVFAGGYRVRIEQGYGDDGIIPVFAGFIDDADVKATPDAIAITCRSGGALLTDQRVTGKVKAKELRGPIVFADRKRALNITDVGGHPHASSHHPAHPPRESLRPDSSQYWLSKGHPEDEREDHTEWLEINLPIGDYERFALDPHMGGLECWVSLYAAGTASSWNGEHVDEGWIDIGAGTVPGTEEGGEPFVRHFRRLDHSQRTHKLGGKFHARDGSKLRVSFRHLAYSEDYGDYRAGVDRLYAERELTKTDAKRAHWILVDDAADVCKWAFMWAGFHEWQVRDFGVRLKNPMTFHQADYLIDIVKRIVSQGNYVFYIDRPTTDTRSLGVPTLRRSHATKPARGIHSVDDRHLLTEIDTKFSKESLAWVIRVRGKEAKHGRKLFEDTIRRYQGEYWPPWSGRHTRIATGKLRPGLGRAHAQRAGRLAGIIKHVTHYDRNLESNDECLMACLLIAMQEALHAYTGTIDIPGNPYFRLDDQISIRDTASGTNTRMWIGHRSSTFTQGENGGWTATLEGALLDWPGMAALVDDYQAMLAKVLKKHQEGERRRLVEADLTQLQAVG